MPRSTQKTVLLICSFLCCCAAIILTSVSYATRYWVTQSYHQENGTIGNTPLELNAGLFVVEGNRPVFGHFSFSMKDAYNSYHGFMNFGLWISTILFIALGMVFGVVAAVFAAVNSAMTPIEEITGLTGLYLWNGLACLFSLIAVLQWVAQYCSFLVDIMWSLRMIDSSASTVVTSHEPSDLGYSFYLLCGVSFLYLANCGLVYLAGSDFNKSKSPVKDIDERQDGMIMLY